MRYAWAILCVLALLVVAGCGDGKSDVSGIVKVDWTPVENGTIDFYPVDGKGQTASTAIKAGQYALRVQQGSMKVAIKVPRLKGKKKLYPDDPKSPERDVYEQTLPPRYSDDQKTELRLEVSGSSMNKDWELSAK